MNIPQLLEKYEVVYVSFEESEEPDFKDMLLSFGFDLSEKLKSPAKIHRDRSISFISGFCEGMLYSSDQMFKKYRPNYLKTDFKELSSSNTESSWYKIRRKCKNV